MKNKRKYLIVSAAAFAVYIILIFLLLAAERRTPDSSINSIFDAIWYSFVTFSTVGYGDCYPVTALGRLVGLTFIILSVSVLGLIVGHLASVISEMRKKRRLGLMGTNFTEHVVIVGYDSFAADVVAQLLKAERCVAILTDRQDDIELIHQTFPEKQVFAAFTDIQKPGWFELANVKSAFAVLLNNGDDTAKLISIINIRRLFPKIEIIVMLGDSGLSETFKNAGVTYVISKNDIASKLLASFIFEPVVASFTSDLIASTDSAEEYDIQQFRVLPANPFAGKTYIEMFSALKEKYNVVCIGLYKNGTQKLVKLPDDGEKIEAGDDVVVIVNGYTEKLISMLFETKEGKF